MTQQLRRVSRRQCWCGGELGPFEWHESYSLCQDCGCYVNHRPPAPEELTRVYGLDAYWREKQTQMGFPTIEDRAELYRQDGRLDRWLGLIGRYAPSGGSVIEVGCAPGVLLTELNERGHTCIGVEINPLGADWLRDQTSLDIRAGAFPGVELPGCDVFCSFDCLEHSPWPDRFLRAAADLLPAGGTAIIQTAIDRYQHVPPFGCRQDIFDDIEHLFLFSDEAMARLGRQSGLELIDASQALWIAGEICVYRKPR